MCILNGVCVLFFKIIICWEVINSMNILKVSYLVSICVVLLIVIGCSELLIDSK